MKNNILIHSDNLPALIHLNKTHKEAVQCIYIDPLYNTKNTFKHYKDKNDDWLEGFMKPRLEAMLPLLKPSGIFFCSIDDNNSHYLKILLDEIFGRKNYIGSLIWTKKKRTTHLSKLSTVTEPILVYAKDIDKAPKLAYGETEESQSWPLNNSSNQESILTFPARTVIFDMKDQFVQAKNMDSETVKCSLLDPVTIVNGKNENRFSLSGHFRYSQATLNDCIANNEEVRIAKEPFRPRIVKKEKYPKTLSNLLSTYNLPTYEDSYKESVKLFGVEQAFDYPKPEALISFLIETCTSRGDIVLDAFLGSGTTAAAAHKIGRSFIGIEQGEHFNTHVLKRLEGVPFDIVTIP